MTQTGLCAECAAFIQSISNSTTENSKGTLPKYMSALERGFLDLNLPRVYTQNPPCICIENKVALNAPWVTVWKKVASSVKPGMRMPRIAADGLCCSQIWLCFSFCHNHNISFAVNLGLCVETPQHYYPKQNCCSCCCCLTACNTPTCLMENAWF